jgi:glyoxylase-like metal-dependent hydrolase (beta-lactamase superfamily II)
MPSQQILGPISMIDSSFNGDFGVLGTYLVKAAEPVVIDPGPTAMVPGVLDELRRLKVYSLRYIALTHIHMDHAGGAWRLLESYPDADVFVHPRGAEHLVDPRKLVESATQFFGDRVNRYGEMLPIPPMKITESEDGMVLDLGDLMLKVVWTPGHASHDQSFFEPDNRILILGDSGGMYSQRLGVILPASPPPFNPRRAVESLDRLIELNPEIVCYSHFGYAYEAVRKLRLYREQVILWDRIVTEAVDEGRNMAEIYERLKDNDPMLRLTLEAERSDSSVFYSSIVGFVEYAKWILKSQGKGDG